MYQEPKFDENQFAGRKQCAVSANYRGEDEWESTGISFQDLGGMTVKRRKVQQVRRLKTPAWAMSDEQTRAVVLRFVEDRLAIREHTDDNGTRLDRILFTSKGLLPEKKRQLEKLMLEYTRLATVGGSKTILASLAVQIQNRDSEILVLERGLVAVATAIVYRYYRQGANSVQIAEELGIKSPMIRVWLYRMNTAANRLGIGEGSRKVNTTNRRYNREALPGKRSTVRAWPKEKVMVLFAMRTAGVPWRKCAQVLGEVHPTLVSAWRYYFGDLRVFSSRRVPIPKRVGLSELRQRMVYKLRTLFILRSSGKTWTNCAKALGCSVPNVIELWRRHFEM